MDNTTAALNAKKFQFRVIPGVSGYTVQVVRNVGQRSIVEREVDDIATDAEAQQRGQQMLDAYLAERSGAKAGKKDRAAAEKLEEDQRLAAFSARFKEFAPRARAMSDHELRRIAKSGQSDADLADWELNIRKNNRSYAAVDALRDRGWA